MNQDIPSVVFGAFATFWENLLGFLPNIIGVVAVMVVGPILAKVAKIVVERLLTLLHFDKLVAMTGLESYMRGSGYKVNFTTLISWTIYWLIILMAITAIADLLKLHVISSLFQRFVLYMPNIIVAIIILIVGTILSRIVNRYVFNSLKDASIDFALGVAIFVEIIVQVFTWFLALEQLQINTVLLIIVLGSAFAAIALASAIAFGFAGRELAGDMLAKARRKIEDGIDDDRS